MRILFICKNRDLPSYSKCGKFGLFNSASFVCNAIKSAHDTKIISVTDANDIDREITSYKPDIVILEALWVLPSKLAELQNIKRHRNIKWIIRIHSKATFLANEGIAFNWINQYITIPNVYISTNNKEFNNDMIKVGYDTIYLPNIYGINYHLKWRPTHDKSILKIGCFGALRPMKNHLHQAMAAIIYADKLNKHLEFHINGTRTEQKGENVLKNLINLFDISGKHKLIMHDWLPHHEFCKLVSTMDMGMQVSLSESFNIVAADFVSIGVPIVVCDEIKFVFDWFRVKTNDTNNIIQSLINAKLGSYINLQQLSK